MAVARELRSETVCDGQCGVWHCVGGLLAMVCVGDEAYSGYGDAQERRVVDGGSGDAGVCAGAAAMRERCGEAQRRDGDDAVFEQSAGAPV